MWKVQFVLFGVLLGVHLYNCQDDGSVATTPRSTGVTSSSGELDSAYEVIYRHSPELESDHVSHLESLNERSALTRAVKLVLDSMKQIARDTDLKTLKYRTIDGLGNNLEHPMWGASLHPELRLIPNAYDDKKSVPRYRSKSGNPLPSARDVSMQCFKQDNGNLDNEDKYMSQMHMQFGQFLDHDIIFTEQEIGSECCKDMNADGTHADMMSGGPCFPIKVSDGDRHFQKCIAAKRSLGVDINGVREQINAVSSYVDASQVYGPSTILMNELRAGHDGLLKLSSASGLPLLDHLKCTRSEVMPKCPHAGDPRANVFPGLTIIHTMFHREHNRIATELKKVNSHWDDERLFQEARKILIAVTQKITYDEYLPKLLGPDFMAMTGVSKPYVYDKNINAGVSSVFGAAAFRFGHSQINRMLKIHKGLMFNISDTFFKPEIGVNDEGEMKNIIINQARQRAMKSDHFFTTEVLDHLFEDVDAPGESHDLPGLAVQRCRDHGLPAWKDYVNLCMKTMADAHEGGDSPVTQLNMPLCLTSGVYEDIDDVDLFAGALYETPVRGGIVGPTFAFLIGEQFARLKHGDRFWYETQDPQIGFTIDQLDEIRCKGKLANLLCRNSLVQQMHAYPMETRRLHAKQDCSAFSDINWSLWKEEQ